MQEDEPPEERRLPLRHRILLFLLFATLSYGAYYLLAEDPLGYRFHPAHLEAGTPTPTPHPPSTPK